MKAHARSIASPLPYVTYLNTGYSIKRHDTIQSALNFVHDNHPVRSVRIKGQFDRFQQCEIWAESMVTNEPVFMGILEREV